MKHLRTFLASAIALMIATSCHEVPSVKDEISANPTEVSLPADGSSSVSVTVTASSNDWKIVKDNESAWISAVPEGDNSVLVSAGANTAESVRNGSFSLVCGSASQVVKVTQAAARVDVVTTDKNSVDLDASGAPSQEIKVTANGNWTVTVDDEANSWIIVTPKHKGYGFSGRSPAAFEKGQHQIRFR